MTDRELLEAAAKAAGIKARCVGNGEPNGTFSFYTEPDQLWWNPLANDGDALRLAVKLRLEVTWWKNGVMAETPQHGSGGIHPFGDDPVAATRRAIVRAAAAMGAA